MKIAFDADGVLVDLMSIWTKCLNEHFGTNVQPEDVVDWDIQLAFPTLTNNQIYAPFNHDEFWNDLQPIAGAQECVRKLKEDGHEVYIVTASGLKTIYAKTRRLRKLFPEIDRKHIIICHDKSMILADVLIDDKPDNLINGQFKKILFDAPHNRGFAAKDHNVFRADNHEDVYEAIELMDYILSGLVKFF